MCMCSLAIPDLRRLSFVAIRDLTSKIKKKLKPLAIYNKEYRLIMKMHPANLII
jgi:hypothetical protein